LASSARAAAVSPSLPRNHSARSTMIAIDTIDSTISSHITHSAPSRAKSTNDCVRFMKGYS
jgi:hypothetical protein